jgi:FkbM family methyltransferase
MLKNMVRRALPHPVYRMVRQRTLARRVRHYDPKTHTGRHGPHELTLRFEDSLAEGWYGRDKPELPEIAKLRELGALRPGARVFDLGAFQGIVALTLALEAAPGAVVAVEADERNARLARANLALNPQIDNLEVVHAAVTDSDGTVTFAEEINGRIDETTALGNARVPAITIDTLCATYGVPDVVYLDIEGYELRSLRTATRAMGATFFVEVHVGQIEDGTAADVLAVFDGWDKWTAVREWTPFEPFDDRVIPGHRFFLIAKPA